MVSFSGEWVRSVLAGGGSVCELLPPPEGGVAPPYRWVALWLPELADDAQGLLQLCADVLALLPDRG